MKFFMITCMRGHCGCGNGTEMKFAIMARNLLEACDKAKRMPAIKHSRKVLAGKEISEIEYMEYRKISAYKRIGH